MRIRGTKKPHNLLLRDAPDERDLSVMRQFHDYSSTSDINMSIPQVFNSLEFEGIKKGFGQDAKNKISLTSPMPMSTNLRISFTFSEASDA